MIINIKLENQVNIVDNVTKERITFKKHRSETGCMLAKHFIEVSHTHFVSFCEISIRSNKFFEIKLNWVFSSFVSANEKVMETFLEVL